MKILVVIFTTTLAIINRGSCYSKGPPLSTCLTMFPKHKGAESRTGPSPFKIKFSKATYSPGEEIEDESVSSTTTAKIMPQMVSPFDKLLQNHILQRQAQALQRSKEMKKKGGSVVYIFSYFSRTTEQILMKLVTLSADDKRIFTGFQIRVHRLKGDTEEIQGTFTKFPEEKLKSFDCMGAKKNLLGHKNKDPVTQIEVTWKAPITNEGDLVFTATIVEDFSTFWANVNAVLSASVPYDPPPVRQVSVADSRLDFMECGESIGCVLYPMYCRGEDCDVGLTYQTQNDEVTFQMFARGEGYVSVGFSDDQMMGNDQTISCTAENDRVTIQHGRNPQLFNDRQYMGNQISNMRTMHKDGMLYCSFTRPKRMSVYNPSFPNNTQYFDLNDDYYLMVAWGYTYKGTDVMGKHKELPITTHSKVNFKAYKIYLAGALPLMTKIHGFLMLLAWMVFAGLAAIISRYYRRSFGSNFILGAALWFQSHRLVALLTFGFTAASFVLIFVKVLNFTNDAVLHAWFGITVMATTSGQILAGLLRPGLKSKMRPIFNWGYWFSGKILQLLSIITCFLAFNSKFIPEPQKLFGTIVISVWLGIQIIWEVFYEVRKCRQKSKEKEYDLKKGSESPQATMADKLLLITYSFTVALALVAGILAIFMF